MCLPQPKKPAPPSKFDETRGVLKLDPLDAADDPNAERLQKLR